MQFVEAIEMAEASLNRPLAEDEFLLLGRLVESGADADLILSLLGRPEEPSEEDLEVHRYEAGADQAVPI